MPKTGIVADGLTTYTRSVTSHSSDPVMTGQPNRHQQTRAIKQQDASDTKASNVHGLVVTVLAMAGALYVAGLGWRRGVEGMLELDTLMSSVCVTSGAVDL